MSRKRLTAEQIIGSLREADVRLSQGKAVGQASREIGITEQTYYRWRKEHGGMKTAQVKRLKDLEKENGRLKRALEGNY
jgi:transposase-like protein